MNRRLGEPHSWSGHCGEEEDVALVGNRTSVIRLVARRCTELQLPMLFLLAFVAM
jgi:hypothetical protein